MELPAKTLKDAFNACNPTEYLPAGDSRYEDLGVGRGQEAGAVAQCRQRILWSDSAPLVQLFAGHRGCGKSTELRRLQRQLEDDGYYVALIEAESDLDLEDTEPADILLALLRGFDESLRQAGITVSEKLLEELQNWFAEITEEDTSHRISEAEAEAEVKLGGALPFVSSLLARFTGRIKTGSESKRQLRRKLDPQISQLQAHIRTYVGAARLAARQAGKRDLVLIVDSLDRVAFKVLPNGRSSHELLFIDRGDLLRGLGCHAVLTVPISLLFSASLTNLAAIFPHRHVVPMVKLRVPGTLKKAEGFAALEKLLARRLELTTLFKPGVAADLIEASGGHPRELCRLVQYSLDFVAEPPITRQAAEKAIRRLANDYERSIPEEFWPLLAQVHRTKNAKNDADHQLMLFNLSVLEYQNDHRWCDVHPALEKRDRFKAAMRATEPSGVANVFCSSST